MLFSVLWSSNQRWSLTGSVDELGPARTDMSTACVLVNPEHPLAQIILARALLEDVVFDVPAAFVEGLVKIHAAALRVFPSALRPYKQHDPAKIYIQIEGGANQLAVPEGARRLLIGTGAMSEPPESTVRHVRIHDMLPPLPGSQDEQMFQSWMQASRTGETPELEQTHRHWCDSNDAVPAIIELVKGNPKATTYNITGRRSWTLEATWQEFDTLYKRTKAGETGRFESEHLEAKGIPSVGVVELTSDDSRALRPNLSTTHAYLESKTGEGWRPTTPLRRSLMFVIAKMTDAQSS